MKNIQIITETGKFTHSTFYMYVYIMQSKFFIKNSVSNKLIIIKTK